MYLNIVFLPFLGSFIGGFFGRFLGPHGSAIDTTSCIGSACLMSLVAFFEVALSGCPCYIKIAPWIDSELFNVPWGFLFDSLTVVMLVVVLLFQHWCIYTPQNICHTTRIFLDSCLICLYLRLLCWF